MRESNETNNVRAGSAITVTIADLVMTSVAGATSAAVNSQIAISSTVKNQGTGGAAALSVGLYLSTDDVITTSDRFLGQRYIYTGLAAGASDTASTTVSIPSGILLGTYYLGAIADCSGAVPESNEANNALASSAITVTIADLVTTSVAGPTSAAVNSQIAISSTVKNQGTGSAAAFSVGLYLSTDDVVTTSDRFLGQRYIYTGLAAGASDTASTTVSIPSGILLGTYYLGATADYSGAVPESNEANNALASSAITVTSP